MVMVRQASEQPDGHEGHDAETQYEEQRAVPAHGGSVAIGHVEAVHRPGPHIP